MDGEKTRSLRSKKRAQQSAPAMQNLYSFADDPIAEVDERMRAVAAAAILEI